MVMILLPGIIFRASYLNTGYSRKTFKSSFSDELLFSLVPAVLIQITGYGFVEFVFGNVNESLLYLLLINNDKAAIQILDGSSVFLFVLYCAVIYMVSWCLGLFARKIVLKHKLDILYPMLRLHSEWYYILSGTILEFPDQFGQPVGKCNIWLDVLVDSKAGNIIYSGVLKKYILGKDEGLDRIYLAVVERKFLKTNSIDIKLEGFPIDANNSYFLSGEYLIIPYSEIRNINVDYYIEDNSSD